MMGYHSSLIAQMVKNLPAMPGDTGSIPGLRRSPGGGNGNLLQYSCLENSTDRGAWWAAVYGVAESWTGLSTAVLGRHCIAFCIPRQTVFPHEHFSIAELVQRVRQSRENAVSGINRLGVESSSASSLIAVDFP